MIRWEAHAFGDTLGCSLGSPLQSHLLTDSQDCCKRVAGDSVLALHHSTLMIWLSRTSRVHEVHLSGFVLSWQGCWVHLFQVKSISQCKLKEIFWASGTLWDWLSRRAVSHSGCGSDSPWRYFPWSRRLLVSNVCIQVWLPRYLDVWPSWAMDVGARWAGQAWMPSKNGNTLLRWKWVWQGRSCLASRWWRDSWSWSRRGCCRWTPLRSKGSWWRLTLRRMDSGLDRQVHWWRRQIFNVMHWSCKWMMPSLTFGTTSPQKSRNWSFALFWWDWRLWQRPLGAGTDCGSLTMWLHWCLLSRAVAIPWNLTLWPELFTRHCAGSTLPPTSSGLRAQTIGLMVFPETELMMCGFKDTDFNVTSSNPCCSWSSCLTSWLWRSFPSCESALGFSAVGHLMLTCAACTGGFWIWFAGSKRVLYAHKVLHAYLYGTRLLPCYLVS